MAGARGSGQEWTGSTTLLSNNNHNIAKSLPELAEHPAPACQSPAPQPYETWPACSRTCNRPEQCFGAGFRGPLDPNPDPGALKKVKILNNHNIILHFSDFYNILLFN